jgi:hypothetical protein
VAREESDREDLMREATALVERIELRIGTTTVTAGYRANGALSLFFGADPVYQFNAAGELRRAYVAGMLYKASDGALVSIRRERTESETRLLTRTVTAAELQAFAEEAERYVRELRAALEDRQFAVVAQVPADAPVLDRLVSSCVQLDGPLVVARRPHA